MEGIAKLIPEVYYDLIARVPAGIIFLALLGADPHFMQPPLTLHDLNGTLAVAFVFLGYAVGLVLSGIGAWIGTITWKATWKSVRKRDSDLDARMKHDFHDDLPVMYEHLCRDDRDRAVLIKLNAEVMLCANLLVAFLMLAISELVLERFQRPVRIAAILTGVLFSFIAVCTRQYNATRRQRTLLAARWL